MAIVEIFKFPTPVPDSVARGVLLHKASGWEDVFGAQAKLYTQAPDQINQVVDMGQRSYDWGLSVIIFVLVAVLYYVGMRFFRELIMALKNSVSLEKCVGLRSNRSVDYTSLIRYSVLLMALGWVTMAFYYMDYLGSDSPLRENIAELPWWAVYLMTLGLFLGVWCYQIVMTIACKWIGGWSSFYSVLAYLGQFTTVMFSFVALPVMLVMMLVGMHPLWPFSLILILYVFHFVRVSKHFITNGFAPLQCFLYLCTVEILPFGTIWLLNR